MMRMKHPYLYFAVLALPALFLSHIVYGQNNGVMGYWKEPGGSVIHIEPCGSNLCATLADISPSAPGRFDRNNPDAALRNRSLCGLRIGEGFHLNTPTKAEDGYLYDPKSGKTYRGTMTSSGNDLNMRGYIGISLFGRSERWTRSAAVQTCSAG